MKKTIVIVIIAVLALLLILGSFCIIFRHERRENKNGCCINGNFNNKPFSKEFQLPKNNEPFFNIQLNNKILDYAIKLKLTDEQINKIKALIQKDNASAKVLTDKILADTASLRELAWSKNYTQAAVDKITKEISDTKALLQTNNQKLKVDIQAILTSEQIAQYKALNPMKGINNLRNGFNLDGKGNRFYRNGK